MSETILKQYDGMGRDYVRNQREFFAGKDDWTRVKLRIELKREKGGRVLDIGCGGGDDIQWCETEQIEVYGIDASETMCAIAKETVTHPERIKVGDYEHISFPDSYFDVVVGRFSLHYLQDFTLAYREVARVLRSHGRLLIVVNHPTFDALRIAQTKEHDVVSVKLYNDAVTVKFPPHSFADYFSETFFELFELKEIGESNAAGAKLSDKVPEALFFAAVKK